MSSFNTVVKNIFDSNLSNNYAFIERVKNDVPKVNYRIFNIDIIRCRKNKLYYEKYDYPVFTVMDRPIKYKNQTEPGLYYVESKSYFPLRGNGWYYYPMIDYCLSNNIIKKSDIKFVVTSSLSVKSLLVVFLKMTDSHLNWIL